MNPLYNLMNPQTNQLLQKFQQFQRMFHGDARQQVQQMLNSGRVTQQQYDQAVKTAQQFQRMLNGK